MPNFRFVVDFYDPFTDERLDPPTSAELYQDPRIPNGLQHTVHQAKALVGAMDRDTFKALAIEVGQQCDRGNLVGIQRWQELASDRDYRYIDDAETLRLALLDSAANVPTELWARNMGVLALCLTAGIYCELWPEPRYKAVARAEILDTKLEPLTPRKLQEMATVAARAVLLGEAFRDVRAAEAKFREANRANGPKAHRDKHIIADKFVGWAMQLPHPNEYTGNTTRAANFFKASHHLSEQEKKLAAAETFSRRLSERLREHVMQHSLPHPFEKSD